jgi:hypothetical protein
VVSDCGGVRGTLMIDDPLSLLSLGIWLMAAGMWPVGFLFGACSACCDECPPCDESKCTHNCNADHLKTVNAYTGIRFSGSVGDFTFDETDFAVNTAFDDDGNLIDVSDIYKTVDGDPIPLEDKEVSGLKFREGLHKQVFGNNNYPFYVASFMSDEGFVNQGVWLIPVEDVLGVSLLPCLEEAIDFNQNFPLNQLEPEAFFFGLGIGFSQDTDECGCSVCRIIFGASLYRQDTALNVGRLQAEASASASFSSCGNTSLAPSSLTLNNWAIGADPVLGEEIWVEFGCDLEEVQAWVNENFAVSITGLEIDECDCGACCDEGCEDNVAEGGCENWAGVGTSCCDDPDPCAEE